MKSIMFYFYQSPNAHFILVCRDAGRSENLGERAVIEGHLTEQVKLLDLQKSDGWAIHIRSSRADFIHGLLVHPQGCQGCQKIKKKYSTNKYVELKR